MREFGDSRLGRRYVAVVSDLHWGSKHHDAASFARFFERVRIAYPDCRTVVVGGDVLDGTDAVLTTEQHTPNQPDQIAIGVDAVLGCEFRGAEWLAIDGNHDNKYTQLSGAVSGELVQSGMRAAGIDWTFLGDRRASALVSGAHWHLWHPSGGGSKRNTLRTKLNARAELIADHSRRAADVLVMGHYHRHVSVSSYPERTLGFTPGTLQRTASAFAESLSEPWDVGGVVVGYRVWKDGTVTDRSAEFLLCRQYRFL